MTTTAPLIAIYHIPKTGGQSVRNYFLRTLGEPGYVHVGPYGDQRRQESGALPFLDWGPDRLAAVRVVHGHYLTEPLIRRFPDRNIHRVVILRDPLRRAASHYNHVRHALYIRQGRPPATFWEWYDDAIDRYPYDYLGRKLDGRARKLMLKSLGDDYQCKFIAGAALPPAEYQGLAGPRLLDACTELLEGFQFVGTTDQLDDLAGFLSDVLDASVTFGVANRAADRLDEPWLADDETETRFGRRNQADVTLYRRFARG